MILTARTIITGDGKSVLRDGAVLIRDGIIRAVGLPEEIRASNPAESVKDFGDRTILPGLIDMHQHLCYWYSKPDAYLYDSVLGAFHAQYAALQSLFHGVTTIRSAADGKGIVQKLKLAKEKGLIRAPRLFACDEALIATGGHGWVLPEGTIEVDGADNIRAAVRKLIRDGADWIKAMDSDRSDVSEYTQEELNAITDECHRHRKKCFVHAGTQPAIEMCIKAGFDTIEHGTWLTEEQALEMKAKSLSWTPTIIAYTYIYDRLTAEGNAAGNGSIVDEASARDFEYYRDAARTYRENFKKLYDTGVNVLAGTDMVLDGAPFGPVARELQYMVDYGITPVEAIATATGNAAAALDMKGKIGILGEGAFADLLIVEGDASKDIKALTKIVDVYQDGCPVRREI